MCYDLQACVMMEYDNETSEMIVRTPTFQICLDLYHACISAQKSPRSWTRHHWIHAREHGVKSLFDLVDEDAIIGYICAGELRGEFFDKLGELFGQK
jgi:hypothetical protein